MTRILQTWTTKAQAACRPVVVRPTSERTRSLGGSLYTVLGGVPGLEPKPGIRMHAAPLGLLPSFDRNQSQEGSS